MAQRHISLSISPFLVIYANTFKSNKRSTPSLQIEDQILLHLVFGIFGLFFATTWFVFANQILFPISKSNTLVWANRKIFQE
jgi:phosphate/sulfate permease